MQIKITQKYLICTLFIYSYGEPTVDIKIDFLIANKEGYSRHALTKKREAFAFLARNSESKEYSKRFTQLTETKMHKESSCLLAIEFPRFTSESSQARRPMGKTQQR